MATLLFHQTYIEDYKKISEDLKPEDISEVKILSQPIYQTNPSDKKSAAEVLELNEIKNTQNAMMFLNKTAAGNYKTASEFVSSPKKLMPKLKRKSLKQLIRQSVFHGSSWLGDNFIA